MTLFLCILSFVFGGLILFLCIRPKLIATIKLNQFTEQQNQEIQNRNSELSAQNQKLQYENADFKEQAGELKATIASLTLQKQDIQNSISDLENQIEITARSIENKSIEIASRNIEEATIKLGKEYQEIEEHLLEQYLVMLEEASQNYNERLEEKKEKLSNLEKELTRLENIVTSAVEENKRAAASQEKQDFYRLVIPEADKVEIARLKEVLPYLRDKETLNKVIYKIYYEKPYTDLIGRVVGSGIHTGIYKITNIENNMCYIGQSVSISERWKQHIKRGMGADTPTRNKLYPAMLEFGVENFTFEIIEECPKNSLDEREQFWQNFYKAKEFGYSIR